MNKACFYPNLRGFGSCSPPVCWKGFLCVLASHLTVRHLFIASTQVHLLFNLLVYNKYPEIPLPCHPHSLEQETFELFSFWIPLKKEFNSKNLGSWTPRNCNCAVLKRWDRHEPWGEGRITALFMWLHILAKFERTCLLLVFCIYLLSLCTMLRVVCFVLVVSSILHSDIL